LDADPQSSQRLTEAFGELFSGKVKRIARTSPFSSLPGWHLQPIIVKYGDQVLQEEVREIERDRDRDRDKDRDREIEIERERERERKRERERERGRERGRENY